MEYNGIDRHLHAFALGVICMELGLIYIVLLNILEVLHAGIT